MSWTDEAYAEAERRDMADTDWCALSAESLFAEGAEWMRDRLRTGEAVERVARALLHSDWPADQEDRDYHWKHFADSYREKARTAITALIGDET